MVNFSSVSLFLARGLDFDNFLDKFFVIFTVGMFEFCVCLYFIFLLILVNI